MVLFLLGSFEDRVPSVSKCLETGRPIFKMSSVMLLKLILSPAATNKIKNTRLGQSLTGVNLT